MPQRREDVGQRRSGVQVDRVVHRHRVAGRGSPRAVAVLDEVVREALLELGAPVVAEGGMPSPEVRILPHVGEAHRQARGRRAQNVGHRCVAVQLRRNVERQPAVDQHQALDALRVGVREGHHDEGAMECPTTSADEVPR